MNIKYEVRTPDKKFNSCIEGRIFSLFDFFLEEKRYSEDMYMFLEECKLEYVSCDQTQLVDPWYYQPVRLLIEGKYEVSSKEGFQSLAKFINRYGVYCEQKFYNTKQETIDAIIKTFERGNIPIAMIDQFYFSRSSKFQVQKEALHALLLSGINTEKKIFMVVDSKDEIEKNYQIPFEELEKSIINWIIVLGNDKKKSEKIFIPKIQISGKGIQTEIDSGNVRLLFLEKIWAEVMLEFNNVKIQGCSINIRYKIIPYLIKTKKYFERERKKDISELVILLIKHWEILSLELLKSLMSGKRMNENEREVIYSLEKQLIYVLGCMKSEVNERVHN